jgi:hypothetical protein
LDVLDNALCHLSRDVEECAQVTTCRSALLEKYPDLTNPPAIAVSVPLTEQPLQPTATIDTEQGVQQEEEQREEGTEEEEEEEELIAPDLPDVQEDENDVNYRDENDISTSPQIHTELQVEMQKETETEEGEVEIELEVEQEGEEDDGTIDVARGLSTVERMRRNPMPRLLGSAQRNTQPWPTSSSKSRRVKIERSSSSTTDASSSGTALQGSYVTLGLVRLRKDAREELGVSKAATPQVSGHACLHIYVYVSMCIDVYMFCCGDRETKEEIHRISK